MRSILKMFIIFLISLILAISAYTQPLPTSTPQPSTTIQPSQPVTPSSSTAMSNDPAVIQLMGKRARYGQVDDGIPTAIVLSGGGAKGSFEAGALAYLTRPEIWRTINLKYVCGTSVGAINALKIAESGKDGIKDLVSLYVSLQSEDDMFVPQENLKKIIKILKDEFGTELSAADFSGGGPVFKVPRLDAGFYIANSLTLGAMGAVGLNECLDKHRAIKRVLNLFLNAPSLFTLAPIEAKIRSSVDFRNFGPNLSDLISMRLAVVCLEDAKTWYVTENGNLIRGNANNPEEIWNLVNPNGMLNITEALVHGTLASAAIPSYFEAKQLRADQNRVGHFVDGGVRDVLPVRAALELGAKRVIALMAGPIEPVTAPTGSYHDAKLFDIMFRSLDTITSEVAANELKPEYGRWPSDVAQILITPEVFVHDTREVNPGLIGINMGYGYMRAYELTLKQLMNRDLGLQAIALWANTRAIAEVRKRIWDIEHNRDGGGPLLELKPEWSQKLVWDERRNSAVPKPPERVVVFNKPMLDFLRQKKRELLKLIEERMELLNYDRSCIPLKFEGGTPASPILLKPADWWTTWERHGPKAIFPDQASEQVQFTHIKRDGSTEIQTNTYSVPAASIQFDAFYFRWNLWSERHPIDFNGRNYTFESELPVAPAPSQRLMQTIE